MLSVRAQWLVLVGLVAASAGGARVYAANRTQIGRVTVGDRAPSFPRLMVTAAGGPERPASLERGPRLVVVWASWCGACREELPSLQLLHRRLAPRGLQMTAVSVDDRSAAETVRKLVAGAGITFDVALDTEGHVARAYGVGPVPQAFLIGRDGEIRERFVGRHDWSDPRLVERLKALMAP